VDDDYILNERQKRFVEEYLIDLNATQAAIRAGYSEYTAQEQGSRLLSNVMVQAALKQAIDERSERVKMTQDDVLRELAILAMSDVSNYVYVDGDGVIYARDFRTIPKAATRAIKKIKQTVVTMLESTDEETGEKKSILKTKTELEFYDKIRANELMGKHLGMFQDKTPDAGASKNESKVDELFADVLLAFSDEAAQPDG
jgi:phage terminase small subunit